MLIAALMSFAAVASQGQDYPAFLWLAYEVKYSALNKSQSCKLVSIADPQTHREYPDFRPSDAFTAEACAHFAAVGERSDGSAIWSKSAPDTPTYPVEGIR